MIKSIFFDLDGTLLSFKTHQMPKSTQYVLKELKNKGVKIFLATGRSPETMEFVAHYFDGIVSMNGQYCFCGDDIIYKNPISKSSVLKLMEQAKSQKYSYCFVEAYTSYADKITRELRHIYREINMPLPKIDLPHENSNIYQLMVTMPQYEEDIITSLTNDIAVTRWHPMFVDVIPKLGGKEYGIEAMLKHFGQKREHCMAVGDGENDISMLSYAGIGVAMGNAADIVKQNADFVTDTVDDEGILKLAKRFNLI